MLVLDHENNLSIAFAMSELRLDTLIRNIGAYQLYWQIYRDFVFFTFN